VKWKIAVPSGLSSPIIVGDKLVLTAFGTMETLHIATSGRRQEAGALGSARRRSISEREGSPAASTCATDAKRIISYSAPADSSVYDLAGKELWKFQMAVVSTSGDFAAGLPILADGMVILVA